MHRSISIVTPAACMDLTVLATAKAALGIASTDTSQDAAIATLIKQASGIVSEYCDEVFGAETVTETFWSDRPSEWATSFMLERSPVSSIDSVIIDGVEIDPSGYQMSTDGHLHRVNEFTGAICTWSWIQTTIITYTAGYVLLDSLPYGLERATLLLIQDFKANAGRDPRVRSEDVPGVRNVTYWVGGISGNMNSLPPDVLALLKPHRHLAFA